MKNSDVKVLLDTIDSIGELKCSAKFNYAISKAKNDLTKEVEIINETFKKCVDFTEEELKIFQQIVNREKNESDFDEEVMKTIIMKDKKGADFFNAEFEGEIYKIKLEYLPDDLSVNVFNALMLIVIEE